MLFQAVFTFEAETIEDAERNVGSWTVAGGTTLNAISANLSSTQVPIVIAERGPVAGGGPLLEQEEA
jgi:hypothetical protein